MHDAVNNDGLSFTRFSGRLTRPKFGVQGTHEIQRSAGSAARRVRREFNPSVPGQVPPLAAQEIAPHFENARGVDSQLTERAPCVSAVR